MERLLVHLAQKSHPPPVRDRIDASTDCLYTLDVCHESIEKNEQDPLLCKGGHEA